MIFTARFLLFVQPQIASALRTRNDDQRDACGRRGEQDRGSWEDDFAGLRMADVVLLDMVSGDGFV